MKYWPPVDKHKMLSNWQSQWRLGEEKHSSSIEKSVRQAASNVSSTLKESVQTFAEKCCKLGVVINNQNPTKRKNLLKNSNKNKQKSQETKGFNQTQVVLMRETILIVSDIN